MAIIENKKEIDLNEVLAFVTEKHKGQKRDNGDDYIVHPIRVAKMIDKYKGQYSKNRNELYAAALLHDTLEDTYTSFRELCDKFGIVVASLVQELTTAPYATVIKTKAKYLAEKMASMTTYALLIKLADRYDNISDFEGTPKEKIIRTINDTKYIIDHITQFAKITRSQQIFIDLIKDKLQYYDLQNE